MIPAGAVVGEADARLVLSAGGHQGTVRVEDGAVEEGVWLLPPDADANVVVDVLQRVDVSAVEASAEIACRGGIGNALGVEGVEEVDIVAAQLHVLETVAVTKGVIGEVEDVIGFMIRHVNDEQMQSLIDGVDEADASREQMESADAAVADAVNTVGDFVVDIGRGEDGPIAADRLGFIEPTLHTALASAEAMSYLGVHSKSLSAGGDDALLLHPTPQKLQGISSFSKKLQTKVRHLCLVNTTALRDSKTSWQ